MCQSHRAISCDACPITMPESCKSLESIPIPDWICGFLWDFTRHYFEFERYCATNTHVFRANDLVLPAVWSEKNEASRIYPD